MKDYKLSIVMPTYNQANYIKRAIDSVLNQDYKDFELLILDGGSTDGTKEILQHYLGHPKISYIVSEKDNGQSDALDKGFSRCTGQIYGWLNSDDTYADGAFKKVAAAFKYSNCDVVNGSLHVINKEDQFIDEWPQKRITNKQWYNTSQCIGQPSTFFNAELYKMVGGVNKNLQFAMDYDLFFRFAIQGAKFHFIDDHLANFRVHDESKTMSLPFKFWKEEFSVYYRLSKKRIVSGFYYWKLRGILSYIVKGYFLNLRKF